MTQGESGRKEKTGTDCKRSKEFRYCRQGGTIECV